MSALAVLGICVAGGLGAGLRFLVDGLIAERHALPLPIGTLIINITGSLALGLLTGALTTGHPLLAILGVGLCGGFTTFSTAMLEAAQLVRTHRPGLAALQAVSMLVLSVGAAALGFSVGSVL